MRLSGKLTMWDAPGGFGVITPDEGGDEIFVEAADGLRHPPPLLGELLTFDVVHNRDGTRRAIDITRVSRDEGLSLAPVDTSLNARAAAQALPLYRAAPARPPRRVRAPWSAGRVIFTVLLVAVAAVLLVNHGHKLRTMGVESLHPDNLLPSAATVGAPPAKPRESLAP